MLIVMVVCCECGFEGASHRLSGVKHKLRYGGELRVWEGIAASGGDYGVGGNYTCGKELQSGEKLQVGGNP